MAGYRNSSGFKLKFAATIAAISVILASCSYEPPGAWNKPDTTPTWHEGHLRIIDPADAAKPGADILAVSSQVQQDSLLIRIDFLDNPDPSIYLFVSLSGIQRQDTGLDNEDFHFSYQPGKEGIEVALHGQAGEGKVALHETHDDWLSFKIDGFSSSSMPYAKVASLTDGRIIDETKWIDLRKTIQPAYIFLAFYNTIQSNTPAQVLRSWDGAHTGPQGSRHGLRYLLESASVHQIPITLLDVKQSGVLDALYRLDERKLIHYLSNQGLVFIPEAVYGESSAHEKLLSMSRQSGLQFGLTVSNAVFGPVTNTFPGYGIYFYASETTAATVYSSSLYRLIPVPAGSQIGSLDKQGLTIPALQSLANAGAEPESGQITVLGGDFQESLWGDPVSSSKTMEYIANHPWIHPLTYVDLNQLPAKPVSSFMTSCTNLLCTPEPLQALIKDEYILWQNSIYQQLIMLQPNTITDSAWQLYGRITDPTQNAELARLQWEYRSTLEKLILAAGWASQPYELQTCYDSAAQEYCILANERYLAVISPETAGLEMLFAWQSGSVAQLVAPYSQFMVGLSDPSFWFMDSHNSDPDLIESGFAQSEAMSKESSPSSMSFSFKTRNSVITYALTQDSLVVSIDSDIPANLVLPVPGKVTGTGNNFIIQIIRPQSGRLANLEKVEITGADQIDITSVLDSDNLLLLPEDPNLAYPPGHYLPYPFSLMHIQAGQSLEIKFTCFGIP